MDAEPLTAALNLRIEGRDAARGDADIKAGALAVVKLDAPIDTLLAVPVGQDDALAASAGVGIRSGAAGSDGDPRGNLKHGSSSAQGWDCPGPVLVSFVRAKGKRL